MKPNAAIAYHPESFDTSAERLMGRQAAGEGFLDGLVRHGGIEPLYCFARTKAAVDDFIARVSRISTRLPRIEHIPESRPDRLRLPGCLHVPSPMLGPLAARRAGLEPTAYSLCGVTHTLATTAVIDAIGAYLTAPVEAWDALVCTSAAAKAVVRETLEAEAAYLAERIGAKPSARIELPIIPLGVDCDRFADEAAAAAARAAWRERLGIAAADIAALFVGRLSYHAKANPAPMYLGLEASAAAVPDGGRLHLVLAGWFANDTLERGFREAAAAFCPSVNLIVVDGRDAKARNEIWHAADFFTSLSDNIQESFGLTPIEAMAAGLPSVVADWDGYRDTIVEGETGFRVPTIAPPAGFGRDLAFRYANGIDSYDRHIGGVALCTAVDLRAAAVAFRRLIGDAALRRQLGAAGRARARAHYDWRVVIAAYQTLWAELAARRARAAADPTARLRAGPAVLRDPFALFAGHASATLSSRHRVAWAAATGTETIERLSAQAIANYAPHLFLEARACRALGEAIRDGGPQMVGVLIAGYPAEQRARALRTLLWLAKFGVIEIDAPALLAPP